MDLTGESIKRSLGHRDYGMYGYDIKYNPSAANHDITIGYRQHWTIVTDMIQVYPETIYIGLKQHYVVMTASDYVKSFGAGMSGGVSGNDDYASAESFSIVDRIVS